MFRVLPPRAGTQLRGPSGPKNLARENSPRIFGRLIIYTETAVAVRELTMSPLDINQSDKGDAPRIAVKAFESPGNSFVGGVTDSKAITTELGQDGWLLSTFYFPVDSCIWKIGCDWTAVNNKNNDDNFGSDTPRTVGGIHQIGISLFSTRDLPWNGSDGMTPMTPSQKMSRAPDSQDDMVWAADAIVGLSTEEIALRSAGYYNKAVRQILYFSTMATGTNKSKSIDFTKLSRHKKGRRKARAFDVSAGEKLVFWSRNVTGVNDGSLALNTQATVTPRVSFFPKQNIIQNITYRDESQQRWGTTKAVTLNTDEGDGVTQLYTIATADEEKN